VSDTVPVNGSRPRDATFGSSREQPTLGALVRHSERTQEATAVGRRVGDRVGPSQAPAQQARELRSTARVVERRLRCEPRTIEIDDPQLRHENVAPDEQVLRVQIGVHEACVEQRADEASRRANEGVARASTAIRERGGEIDRALDALGHESQVVATAGESARTSGKHARRRESERAQSFSDAQLREHTIGVTEALDAQTRRPAAAAMATHEGPQRAAVDLEHEFAQCRASRLRGRLCVAVGLESEADARQSRRGRPLQRQPTTPRVTARRVAGWNDGPLAHRGSQTGAEGRTVVAFRSGLLAFRSGTRRRSRPRRLATRLATLLEDAEAEASAVSAVSATFAARRGMTRLRAARFVASTFVATRRALFPARTVVTGRTLVTSGAIVAGRTVVTGRTLVTSGAIVASRTVVTGGTLVAGRTVVTSRAVVLARTVVAGRSIVVARTLLAHGSIVVARALGAHRLIVVARALLAHRPIVVARAFVTHGSIVASGSLVTNRSFGTGGTLVANRSFGTGGTLVANRALVASRAIVVTGARVAARRCVVASTASTARRVARFGLAFRARVAIGALVVAIRAQFTVFAHVVSACGLVARSGSSCGFFVAPAATAAAPTAPAAARIASIASDLGRTRRTRTLFTRRRGLAVVGVVAMVAVVAVLAVLVVDVTGVCAMCFVLVALLRGSRTARALVASATATAAATATCAFFALVARTACVRLDAVGELVADLDHLRRDLVREPQRGAVVEVHAVLPRVESTDLEHRVLARRASTGLGSVGRRQSEVQEAAPARAQAVALRALDVARRDAEIEELGRLAVGAGLDRDRVAVQRADAIADDFVARTITRFDRVEHVGFLDRLTQALVEGADHVSHVREAVGVDFEVELLRPVAQHESQGTGDPLDAVVRGHGRTLRAAVHAGERE